MRRFLPIVISISALLIAAQAQQPTCSTSLETCSVEGCSNNNHHDSKLNILKNLRAGDGLITDRSLAWMKLRKNPKTYTPKGIRTELTNLGEGQQIRVVGYLLAVKLESGEACNCYLQTVEDTDNHLVLVTKDTLDKFPLPMNASKSKLTEVFKKREPESVTIEFTPRVRLDHPNFTNAKLQPIINKTPQGALLVRVTGQLLFDTEHFFIHQLTRVNNWEVHPIFRLEYCPKEKICTAASDLNWVDLDQ